MSTSTTSRPESRLSTRRGVTARRKRRAVLALLAMLLAVGGSLTFAGLASAAPQTVIDQGGEDDLTGQKDLNSLTVDYGLPGATSLSVNWNWDDTATSGANTRDACSLFDTDNDGFANYAFCLTVNDDTTVSTARLYSCVADSRADRCGGPTRDHLLHLDRDEPRWSRAVTRSRAARRTRTATTATPTRRATRMTQWR